MVRWKQLGVLLSILAIRLTNRLQDIHIKTCTLPELLPPNTICRDG